MTTEQPHILFFDDHLLLLHKPSGMPSEATKLSAFGTASSWVEQFLQGQKRPTTFLSAAHRLDTPTSGVLCFGLSKATAGALQEQFANHSAQRTYLAIVEGIIPWEEKRLIHRIEVDKSRSLAKVVKGSQGKEARSAARVLQRSGQKTCLMLQPETGLTHQLRVQCQAEGFPMLGDSRYGSKGAGRVALHAFSLSLKHPKNKRDIFVEAPPPESFWALWVNKS